MRVVDLSLPVCAATADAEPPSARGRLALAVSSGNRCGHVPSAPRFDLVHLPEGANPARPALIHKAIAKLRDYYQAPREARWDVLSQSERHGRLTQRLAAAGGPQTSTGQRLLTRLARWRQQRSERREAVVAALMLLLPYTDIATLTVAVPRGNAWLGLSTPWIATHSGLSPSRVKRALATLSRAQLLTSTGAGRRFDARQRRWVGAGWGPVRRLSFKLIRALGLEVSWAREQRRKQPLSAPPLVPSARSPLTPSAATAFPTRPEALPSACPAPPSLPTAATQREHARTLRQQLAAPAAHPVETDPAARQAVLERNRKIAELAAQGLSPAAIRERLSDAPQPP